MRILLIEDDEVLERLLTDVLADAGIDAVRSMPLSGVDAVLTDLVSLEGYDRAAARAYVALLRARHGVPVIVLTAHGAAAEDGAAALGADAVIAKPFDIDRLVDRVRAVIRSSPAAPPHHSEVVRSRDWEHPAEHR